MTIVFVTRGYPSPGHLQNGNFEATQARALARLGHKVILIGINCYSIKNYDILGNHHRVEDGIEIYEHYPLAIPTHNLMPFNLQSIILAKKLRKTLKSIIAYHGTPDVIHSHYLLMTSAVSRVIDDFNIPFVCTEHWSKINSLELPRKIKKLGKVGYEKPSKVIAVSKKTAESIRANFQREAEVLPNMVNEIFFESFGCKPSRDKFTFVTIGQMNTNIKGFDISIQAFALHQKKYPSSRLIIVGKGNHRQEYEDLVKKLDLQSNIKFISEQSPQEIAMTIEQSHVVLMGSRSETFGVTLIEGMAKGKPVIATKCGGPEDFIAPEMGILVPIENISAMADAMNEIHNNYDQYDKNLIKDSCKANYSQNSIANKLVDIYQEVILKSK